MCEEFKSKEEYLTRCGISMYVSHPNVIVKHFGLQLIQHAVKYVKLETRDFNKISIY